MRQPHHAGDLEHAIADIGRRRAAGDAVAERAMTAAAFRAGVTERLHALEREVAEVRQRVNGLLFVVAGAVVTQVVLRLFA
jgi:hypothetical protein